LHIILFEQTKMDYINTALSVLSAQDVPKRQLEKNKHFSH